MPLDVDDDADDNDDDGNEKVGAVDAAGIGAFSTSAAGIVLGELLPQSPPNGE